MNSRHPSCCIGVIILLMLVGNCRSFYFQRLLGRKLTSNELSSKNFVDIRNIVSASLTANEPLVNVKNTKRDTQSDPSEAKDSLDNESENSNNIASEERDSPIYEDESDENDDAQAQHDPQYKRSPVAVGERVEKSIDQSELANDDESELKNVKSKREVPNEDDYEEDDMEINPESSDSLVTIDRTKNEVERSMVDDIKSGKDRRSTDNNPSETGIIGKDIDLDYEKEIEDQIQQKIDSLKDDIKRRIERKQQVREIEANNAKYDELEFPREDDEVALETPSDSPKRSISSDAETSNDSNNSGYNVRSKRGSEPNEVNSSPDTEKNDLPVKKRRNARHVILVERADIPTRKERSSILIPERGHAEVKDDLPADLTIDPKLRIARSYDKEDEPEISRSVRSASDDEYPAARYRRHMPEELEDNEVNEAPEETANFLFSAHEKPNSKIRRRRGRGRGRARSLDRGKGRKHPRHLRRHRAARESPTEDSERAEERDKRAMSLDEDAALEYKESFGGFPSDSVSGLGRFKRIRRSARIS